MTEDVGEEEHEARESFEEFHAAEVALFSAFATLATAIAIVLLLSLDADEDTPGFGSPMLRAITGMAIAQVALTVHLVAYPSGILSFWSGVFGIAELGLHAIMPIIGVLEVYHLTMGTFAGIAIPLFGSGAVGLARGGEPA